MKYEVGDIIQVPLYIGTAHNTAVYRLGRVIGIYPKGHLGVMYLCKVIPSGFRTCVVIPPPPRLQPETVKDTLQRWSTNTHHHALEVEEVAPRTNKELIKLYDPLIKHLGLDPSIRRSLKQLRSIAHYRGFDTDEIEEGIYRWL